MSGVYIGSMSNSQALYCPFTRVHAGGGWMQVRLLVQLPCCHAQFGLVTC